MCGLRPSEQPALVEAFEILAGRQSHHVKSLTSPSSQPWLILSKYATVRISLQYFPSAVMTIDSGLPICRYFIHSRNWTFLETNSSSILGVIESSSAMNRRVASTQSGLSGSSIMPTPSSNLCFFCESNLNFPWRRVISSWK